MENHLNQFENILGRELTPQLAGLYVQSLVALLGHEKSEDQIIEEGKKWHYEIGRNLYGPLVAGYAQWVAGWCQELQHAGPVFFALRDAAPLMAAASVMWDGTDLYPVGIYANRPLLGIDDEIAPEESKVNGDMLKYLEMLGVNKQEKIIWTDTGAWGTVIKALKEKNVISNSFHPLFWYSHNPHIPGFINELLYEIDQDEKTGEVINDSLECVFPQKYLRPTSLFKDGGRYKVELSESCHVSVVWGEAALNGVRDAGWDYQNGISREKQKYALGRIVAAHLEARSGRCTGVLPENTPTWSKGSDFIASWPANLLP